MLTYKAMYKFLDECVHGEVLDFPGVLTCGKNLEETRRLLADALVDMAETNLLMGETLPMPNSEITSADSDLEEPLHLILEASQKIKIIPDPVYEETWV
jgi:predicted RNase H-like HicB family nuclease